MLTSPRDSGLLRKLLVAVDALTGHLDDPGWWNGIRVGTGSTAYLRIEATQRLVSQGRRPREHSVALHLFDTAGNTALHDHRWPIAVLPFAEGVADGTPLYEMPWQDGDTQGALLVRSGAPYALERCAVRHAVRGLRPHMSVTLADVTDPPTRANRLPVEPISPAETLRAITRVRDVLAARTHT